MPGDHNFEHLPFPLRYQGRALLKGRWQALSPNESEQEARQAHSTFLSTAAQSLTPIGRNARNKPRNKVSPIIPQGIPILVKVDPSLDLDVLREKFAFEIVAEQEEGYVIVAAEDIQLTPFVEMVNGFAVQVRGSATIASVHRLFDDPSQAEHLRRILSDRLLAEWPDIDEARPLHRRYRHCLRGHPGDSAFNPNRGNGTPTLTGPEKSRNGRRPALRVFRLG